MARPQKSRHSREALNDPQIAAKLGGLVLDIEALRTKRKQIDDQIAAAFDAVDDAGFEKKYVRKVVSLRAKETDARRDEEEGLEAYEFAIEKGVSLASARSKPVSSQSYAEAKGRAPELTDTQEQPETATEFQAKASEDNGATGTANVEVPSDSMAGEVSRLDAGRTASATSERMDVTAGETAPLSPSPANAPRLAADDEAAQASQSSSAPISNPQEPNSSPAADTAGDVPPPSSPASSFNNPRCQHPGTCSHAHDQGSCDDCFFDWAKRPLEEQRRLWSEAMEAASETEAA